MAVKKGARLAKIVRDLNIGADTAIEHLKGAGYEDDFSANSKLTAEMCDSLYVEFKGDAALKERSEKITIGQKKREKHALDEKGNIQTITPAEVGDPLISDRFVDKKSGKTKTDPPATPPVETPTVEKPEEKPPVKEEVAKPEVVEQEAVVAKPEVVKPEEKPEKPVVKAPEVKADPVPVKKEEPVLKKEEPKKVKEPVKEVEKPKEKPVEKTKIETQSPKVVGKIDLGDRDKKGKSTVKKPSGNNPSRKPAPKSAKVEKPAAKKPPVKPAGKARKEPPKEDMIERKKITLEGPKVMGKITLPVDKKDAAPKKKRKRIQRKGVPASQIGGRRGGNSGGSRGGSGNKKKSTRGSVPAEITGKEIQEKLKATMARMQGGGKKNRQKLRRSKRDTMEKKRLQAEAAEQQESNVLHVTEFITVSELASLMNIGAGEVISACMSLGTFVSINQRLDAELIDLVASDYDYEVKFIDISDGAEEEDEQDDPATLEHRAPIVTVMGHVDHGKTSLLDNIRSANVIAGESGGITQHIGAYEVATPDGKRITFLDTPGHEAFTAMRARGAKITDIAVIVIASDDAVMPQTKEAISHAQAAGVPIIFAFNKIDVDGSNPERIKEELASMNFLVESWGGKYQSEDISAKEGIGIDKLLEKILLEAEMLELQANPEKNAIGSVIEASLDKGRGYVATVLVQSGSLKVGDVILAGTHYGRVKAMFDERGDVVEDAGPSVPVLILGLNGAPQAGEKFKVYDEESEVKDLANKREQIIREQGRRTKKHITLDEIGRRLALENFKELNLIVKADVDGSVEALADSLLKLSTEEIQVNVVHKAVGQISESDVLLATASDAIIVAFQVRPSLNARRLAEKEEVDIRMYSVIYDAINEIKSAMEGMLEPTIEERITCNLEVREVFKISRVGSIAGCLVQEGKITRNTKVRLVRDGIVKFDGELSSLKRYKDDAKEVTSGMECGVQIKNYNDIKVGDMVEGYEEVSIKRTLA